MKSLNERTRSIRFLATDADGVLFDNSAWHGLIIDGVSRKPKIRSHYDGQGISLLRAIGIRVCVITSSHDIDSLPTRELVDRWNELPSAQGMGGWLPVELFENSEGSVKETVLRAWLSRHGGSSEECAVIGNDLGDAAMLSIAGLACAPADAELFIKKMCHFVTPRNGGSGAIRDVANLILDVMDINPLTLPTK